MIFILIKNNMMNKLLNYDDDCLEGLVKIKIVPTLVFSNLNFLKEGRLGNLPKIKGNTYLGKVCVGVFVVSCV